MPSSSLRVWRPVCSAASSDSVAVSRLGRADPPGGGDLDGHEADPVGDDVVQFPGDAHPLLGDGQLGAAVLLDLHATGPVEQQAGSERDDEQRPEQGGRHPEHPEAVEQEGGPEQQEEGADRDPGRPVLVGSHRRGHRAHPDPPMRIWPKTWCTCKVMVGPGGVGRAGSHDVVVLGADSVGDVPAVDADLSGDDPGVDVDGGVGRQLHGGVAGDADHLDGAGPVRRRTGRPPGFRIRRARCPWAAPRPGPSPTCSRRSRCRGRHPARRRWTSPPARRSSRCPATPARNAG